MRLPIAPGFGRGRRRWCRGLALGPGDTYTCCCALMISRWYAMLCYASCRLVVDAGAEVGGSGQGCLGVEWF